MPPLARIIEGPRRRRQRAAAAAAARRRRRLIAGVAGLFAALLGAFAATRGRRHVDDLMARQYDDVTLAHKVQAEIFRDRSTPKRSISVNAAYGVVYLRGEVPDPRLGRELAEAAEQVEGVEKVENLLHAPGTPAPSAPAPAPAAVKRRMREHDGHAH